MCDIQSRLGFSSANYRLYNYDLMPMGHEQFYVLNRCNQFSALLLVRLAHDHDYRHAGFSEYMNSYSPRIIAFRYSHNEYYQ